MAITTLDGLIAAAKQRVILTKTVSRTSVAAIPFAVYDQAGNPGAATLAGTSTTTGVVPTDATTGFPLINSFGGNKGYITRFEASCSISCQITLYDMLWKAGAYSYNAATSGQTPTSFSSRVPGGTDFTGLEIWFEQVTASTGIQSVACTYINQGGTAGKTTPTQSQAVAGIVGRMTQVPLAVGDSGLQGITGVTGTVATVGTFNVLVLRPLARARIRVANDCVVQDFMTTGMPEIFDTSALFYTVTADSTATGLSEVVVDIANG